MDPFDQGQDTSESDNDSVDEVINQYNKRFENNHEPEGVFDLLSGEDDDEDEGDEYDEDLFNDKYAIQVQKQEMASDIEDEDDEDTEKGLPDAKAWGTEKSAYYDTDYVDKNKRLLGEDEEEEAIAEEEEALAIQRRLLSEMKDIHLVVQDKSDEADEEVLEEGAETEKVKLDVSSLSEREKDQLLKQLHPELTPLINDFKFYLKEGAEILEPIMSFAERPEGSKLKLSSGYHIVSLKSKLVKKYISFLSTYFVKKASGEDIKKHPITPKLLNIKKLISEVETLISTKGLKNDMKTLAKKISTGETVVFSDKEPTEEELEFLNEIDIDNVMSRHKDNAFNFGAVQDGTNAERRNITYEMSKNKGLTAQKKKELRNPRVKHRMKYKKAKTRRKGQVREPRKEVTKYAGEVSGIKANVVRSIKFKH